MEDHAKSRRKCLRRPRNPYDFVLTSYLISYRNNFVIDHKVVTDRNGIQLHEHAAKSTSTRKLGRQACPSHTPAIACQRAGHAGPALSPLGTLSPRCRERSHSSTRARRTTFNAHARTEVIHCPSLAGGNGFKTAQTRRTSRGEQRPRLWAGVDEC